MQRATASSDKEDTDGTGGLIQKWVAPNIPQPPKYDHLHFCFDCTNTYIMVNHYIRSQTVKVAVCGFAECENLNTFGRYSYNKFNKDVEVRMHIWSHGESFYGIAHT